MNAPPAPLAKEWTTLHLICGGFAAAVVVYAVLGWALITRGTFRLPPLARPGGLALSATTAAVLLLLAAPLIQRLLAEDRDARSPGMPVVPFETYRQAIIVAFALREGAAIAGLLITLLTKDLRWVLALGAAALLAMALSWPSPARWERLNQGPRWHRRG